MTIARNIEIARQHLRNGNSDAYHRIMSFAIRAATSDRAAAQYRAALAADADRMLPDKAGAR